MSVQDTRALFTHVPSILSVHRCAVSIGTEEQLISCSFPTPIRSPGEGNRHDCGTTLCKIPTVKQFHTTSKCTLGVSFLPDHLFVLPSCVSQCKISLLNCNCFFFKKEKCSKITQKTIKQKGIIQPLYLFYFPDKWHVDVPIPS